jgi:DNA-binding NarL/FixJ family response regulator
VWRALEVGTWSVVDHWDTDGKRFVVAMRNAPRTPPIASLTERERCVAALAAAGHLDKEIAYVLACRPRPSPRHARARKKLGVRTRTDRASTWKATVKK